MMISGTWNLSSIPKDAPNLKWMVATLPYTKQAGSSLGGENWTMFAASKQQDGAWEFLKFVVDPAYGTKLTDCMTYIPSRKDVLATVAEKNKDNPTMQVFLKQMESAAAARTAAQLVRCIGCDPGSHAGSVERPEDTRAGHAGCRREDETHPHPPSPVGAHGRAPGRIAMHPYTGWGEELSREENVMPDTKRQLDPIPFTQVVLEDAFWAPRIETNRTVSLRRIYDKLVETGRISAFDLDFSRPVPTPIVYIFGDSDPAKWLEAASFSLATHPDPELEGLVDGLADKVISAQQPDGYLNTHFIHVQPEMRWKNLRDWHEMYCAGHLIEGAVAHFEATGSPKLIDSLSRYADLIGDTFGREPGKKLGYCGHPEIELALVRLYRATGNRRYLELASYFIDERGQQSDTQAHYYDIEAIERGEDPRDFWAKNYEYNQSHQPLREQAKVVGHAVRAMYLLSAAADLAGEFEDDSLLETCGRLWDNLVNCRMYLTGGIGPSRNNEGFTTDYDLPDETAYAETCATIGLMMWNQRLLQFGGERKFADVMERGIYNGFLSGVSLDGTRFLYENPLSSAGDRHREEWFYCPCCPPNVARNIAAIGSYFYSTSPGGLWAHLFAGSRAVMRPGRQDVTVQQDDELPLGGAVHFTFEMEPATSPCTCASQAGARASAWPSMGWNEPCAPAANGYLAVTREWKSGDALEYVMDMPIQTVFANPAIRQLEGRVAIQRGPLVYCLEGVDHGGIGLDRITIDPAQVDFGPIYGGAPGPPAWRHNPGARQSLHRRRRGMGRCAVSERQTVHKTDGDHGHPLLRLGQPRSRRDARLDPVPALIAPG